MDYTLDEFDALKARIESVGGQLLDRECLGKSHSFPDPELSKLKELLGARGVRPAHVMDQPGCGGVGLFEIPYTVQQPDVRSKSPLIRGTVILCAFCDNLGDRPRFKED